MKVEKLSEILISVNVLWRHPGNICFPSVGLAVEFGSHSVPGRTASPNSPVTGHTSPHSNTRILNSSGKISNISQICPNLLILIYQPRNDGRFQGVILKVLLRCDGVICCKDYECVYLVEKWNWSSRKQNSGQGGLLSGNANSCQWVCVSVECCCCCWV